MADPSKLWVSGRAVLIGGLIAIAGIAPWTLLAPINARVHPEWPWAALVVIVLLGLVLTWLAGVGWPRSTREVRVFNMRLWRPEEGAWAGDNLASVLGLMAVIAGIYVVWIVASPDQRITDFSAYPTPAYRISVLVMGAVVSGVVEEVAFRGYMQSQLERYGPSFAIGVTSLAFVLMHITHGFEALVLMAPGYFMASVLYGVLALRAGSILPGIVLHVVGDGLYTFFVMIGGDVGPLLRAG